MRAGLGFWWMVVAVVVVTAAIVVAKRPRAQAQSPAAAAGLVKEGERLATIGGCTDCHTPMKFDAAIGMSVPDLTRRLSGHPVGAPDPQGRLGPGDQALVGPTFTSFLLPFGTVYTANLTPDPETGLGRWTEKHFIDTMRTGRHMGEGRPILPPMPWMNLSHASDQDLRAIFAYLKSLPPVKNAVPAPKVTPEAIAKIGEAYAKMKH